MVYIYKINQRKISKTQQKFVAVYTEIKVIFSLQLQITFVNTDSRDILFTSHLMFIIIITY